MNTPFPLFSQKLLVIAVSAVLGMWGASVANAVSTIVMDGTTGTAGAVTIPATTVPVAGTYTIDGATNGTLNGSNLFFSFSQFGIGAGDTALFQCTTCANNTTNVISRVTGANPSVLNGAITSSIGVIIGTTTGTITFANFWFFNPNGATLNPAVNFTFPRGLLTQTGTPSVNIGDKADRVIFNTGAVFGLTTSPTDSTLTVPIRTQSPTPTSFGYPAPVITPVPVSTPTAEPTPTVVIEAPPLRISPQGDISMVVANQPVLTVAIPPLPKSMNPCDSDGQSTLISKGVANYVPQTSSQVPQSIVGTTTGATSLTSIEQTPASTSNESDDCL
ncbi:MAG: filamentous hemagglutinin N-terminal domain-containing protein [Methylococcales bacterium]